MRSIARARRRGQRHAPRRARCTLVPSCRSTPTFVYTTGNDVRGPICVNGVGLGAKARPPGDRGGVDGSSEAEDLTLDSEETCLTYHLRSLPQATFRSGSTGTCLRGLRLAVMNEGPTELQVDRPSSEWSQMPCGAGAVAAAASLLASIDGRRMTVAGRNALLSEGAARCDVFDSSAADSRCCRCGHGLAGVRRSIRAASAGATTRSAWLSTGLSSVRVPDGTPGRMANGKGSR